MMEKSFYKVGILYDNTKDALANFYEYSLQTHLTILL